MKPTLQTLVQLSQSLRDPTTLARLDEASYLAVVALHKKLSDPYRLS
jgi:hypothetical protein